MNPKMTAVASKNKRLKIQLKEMQFQRPVLISGQVFCYNKNHKRGSARFLRLIGHFKLFGSYRKEDGYSFFALI